MKGARILSSIRTNPGSGAYTSAYNSVTLPDTDVTRPSDTLTFNSPSADASDKACTIQVSDTRRGGAMRSCE